MRHISMHRDNWFVVRVLITGLLATMLLVGRLPAAGAVEAPAEEQAVVQAAGETLDEGSTAASEALGAEIIQGLRPG